MQHFLLGQDLAEAYLAPRRTIREGKTIQPGDRKRAAPSPAWSRLGLCDVPAANAIGSAITQALAPATSR